MDGDIALHLNPRAQTRDIFLNSKKAGKWQTEEKVDLPDALSSGKPFRIRVETKKKKFKVWVLREKNPQIHESLFKKLNMQIKTI